MAENQNTTVTTNPNAPIIDDELKKDATSHLSRIEVMLENAPRYDNLGMGSMADVIAATKEITESFTDYAYAVAITQARFADLRDDRNDATMAAVTVADKAQRKAHNHALDMTYRLNGMFASAGMLPFVDLPDRDGKIENTLVSSSSGKEVRWRRDGRKAIKGLTVAMGQLLNERGGADAFVERVTR